VKPCEPPPKPGDLIRFIWKPANRGDPDFGIVLSVTSSVYQIDEIEEEVRYLHQNGQVLDRAYHFFSGRKYIGMREFEIVRSLDEEEQDQGGRSRDLQ
jgi:hypothetical protein